MVKNCQPCSDNGAQYVQEIIAPSGATSCAGPPDGCDQSATPGKTRDQFVISKPDWLPDESWDIVTFLTPYYMQQLVSVAFPSTISAATIRPFLRWVLNSIPAEAWLNQQLPAWHNPLDYTIYDDEGVVVGGIPNMAVGWHCPRLIRPYFDTFGTAPRLLTSIREIRRWGRYLTMAPVANATEFKGRIATASLQFNSALNPYSYAGPGGLVGPDALPPVINAPAGFTSFTMSLQRSATRIFFFDGVRWHAWDDPLISRVLQFNNSYSISIYNTTGTSVVLPANYINLTTINYSPASSTVTIAGPGGTPVVTFSGPVAPAAPLNNQNLRRRDTEVASTVVGADVARYSITPEFSFEALLQADEKSYSNNWIEGATSRQARGKSYLDFTSCREWRPLIRAGQTTNPVVLDPITIKRDMVDMSGKWHIDYVTNADPKASVLIIYGTHYQFCGETNSELQLFKQPPPPSDEDAIKMAETLEAALPHTFPAKFNDGGILPLIMAQVKKVGTAGLAGMARNIVSQLLGGLNSIGTADRLIGYPSMSTTYGNNAVALIGNGNGNGNGKRGNGKNGNGNSLRAVMNRQMNI